MPVVQDFAIYISCLSFELPVVDFIGKNIASSNFYIDGKLAICCKYKYSCFCQARKNNCLMNNKFF